VPGIYRPRHPKRTVLYRVLFDNFDRFLTAYESRFEKEYGHTRAMSSKQSTRSTQLPDIDIRAGRNILVL
jgi:hypothetical protein